MNQTVVIVIKLALLDLNVAKVDARIPPLIKLMLKIVVHVVTTVLLASPVAPVNALTLKTPKLIAELVVIVVILPNCVAKVFVKISQPLLTAVIVVLFVHLVMVAVLEVVQASTLHQIVLLVELNVLVMKSAVVPDVKILILILLIVVLVVSLVVAMKLVVMVFV